MSAFTDPFQLIGEGDFSFRADGVAPEVLDEFQQRAGRWVGTYRTLLDRAGVPRSRLGCKLELRQDSSYEEAQAAAEELRREWDLGDVPAEVLVGVIERELGARVLFVDAPKNVSGAAVHLPGLHTILVNRHEPPGRRNFDIAHELFHLLTWDAMAPDRVEPREVPRRKGNRVERLAENFAGALLMPADVVTVPHSPPSVRSRAGRACPRGHRRRIPVAWTGNANPGNDSSGLRRALHRTASRSPTRFERAARMSSVNPACPECVTTLSPARDDDNFSIVPAAP